MDLKSLKEIDIEKLKEIDASEVGDYLKTHMELCVNIGLVIFTLIIISHSFLSFQNTKADIVHEKKQLMEKKKALKEFEKAENDYEVFFEEWPQPINNAKLSEQLSIFALNNNVNIMSFSPTETKNDDYITLSRVNVKIASNNYQNIVSFIKNIEKAPHTLKIEKCAIELLNNTERSRFKSQGQSKTIAVNLDIASIKINEK